MHRRRVNIFVMAVGISAKYRYWYICWLLNIWIIGLLQKCEVSGFYLSGNHNVTSKTPGIFSEESSEIVSSERLLFPEFVGVFFVSNISPSISCIMRWTFRRPILLLPTSECSCLMALETVTVKRCLRTELWTMTGVPLSPYFKMLENKLVKIRLTIVLSLSRIPVTSGLCIFIVNPARLMKSQFSWIHWKM